MNRGTRRRLCTLSRKFVQPMMKCKFCPLFHSVYCMLISNCKVNVKIGARCANIEMGIILYGKRTMEVTSIEISVLLLLYFLNLSLPFTSVSLFLFLYLSFPLSLMAFVVAVVVFLFIFLFYITKKKSFNYGLNNFYVTQ